MEKYKGRRRTKLRNFFWAPSFDYLTQRQDNKDVYKIERAIPNVMSCHLEVSFVKCNSKVYYNCQLVGRKNVDISWLPTSLPRLSTSGCWEPKQ